MVKSLTQKATLKKLQCAHKLSVKTHGLLNFLDFLTMQLPFVVIFEGCHEARRLKETRRVFAF